MTILINVNGKVSILRSKAQKMLHTKMRRVTIFCLRILKQKLQKRTYYTILALFFRQNVVVKSEK